MDYVKSTVSNSQNLNSDEIGDGDGKSKEPVADNYARLGRDYAVDEATGCWNWLLAKNHRGYGLKWNGAKMVSAHRLYYERAKGAIPPGLQLDHLCRNRACINPDHLEPVTSAENTRRGLKARLTWLEVAAIRSSTLPLRSLSEIFGVCVDHLRRIKNGTKWAEDSHARRIGGAK